MQNSGGCFVPQDGYWQRVREICDKYDVLLIADEVICSWGRLGHYFGVERFGVLPDMITTAKGLTSSYAPMGAVIASDRVADPFMEGPHEFHARHHVRRPPGVSRGGAREPRHLRARGPLRARAREGSRVPRRCSTSCSEDLPIVGDVRGAGYFQALELVKDKETKESFTDEEGEELLRGFMSGELFKNGLICRADDRGDPVIQLSPPLIADSEEFEIIDASCARCSPRRGSGSFATDHMLTVRGLVSEMGLELATGADGADAPVRWVHISELPDPTPWLSGGELLLTTGIQLDTGGASASSRGSWRATTWPGSGSAPASTTTRCPRRSSRRRTSSGSRSSRCPTSCRSSRSPRRRSRAS